MIKIPYTKHDLLDALTSIPEDFFDEQEDAIKAKAISLEKATEGKTNKQRIAEFHGISIEVLVNSPNYKLLCEEFVDSLAIDVVRFFKDLGCTDVQAYALLYTISKDGRPYIDNTIIY